jgi:hypothetical protein
MPDIVVKDIIAVEFAPVTLEDIETATAGRDGIIGIALEITTSPRPTLVSAATLQ